MMALESMIAPVPSEAVMPFVGFLVADGKWDLWAAIAAASTGSVAGSAIAYAMGYYGGKPFVLKVGRYLLLNPHDLELTEAFFSRRKGTLTLFISRFIPVVRHLISVPAGTGKMKLFPTGISNLGDWGYDELTSVANGLFRHEILFSSGAAIIIDFRQVSVHRKSAK